jgi:hypothetical protein
MLRPTHASVGRGVAERFTANTLKRALIIGRSNPSFETANHLANPPAQSTTTPKTAAASAI